MADLAGFRSLGYVATKVPVEKAAAPADVENEEARRRYSGLDPHNSIRLLDPGSVAPGDSPIAQWIESGVLRQDSGRAMYRYHQEYILPDLGGRVLLRRGVLCAARWPSLEEGGIKRHLAVRPAEVAAHVQVMLQHRTHAAPVLAAYRDPTMETDRLFRKTESTPPLLQLQTADGTWHRIWRCGDAEVIGQIRHLFLPRKLYLLEGHERFAAMQAVAARIAESETIPMYSAANYATLCLVNLEDQALLPAPCHRLVSGAAVAAPDVLAKAARYFSIQKVEGLAGSAVRLAQTIDQWTSTQAGFALAFAGLPDVWLLTLLPAIAPREEGVVGHPAVTRLDPIVIEELFLRRVLGKPALPSTPPAASTTDSAEPGEWPVAVVHTATHALAALTAKTAWMAVLARPLPMQQVVHVADLGQELPPHSTHFFPPLLGGLAMLRLTADEDLM